MADRERIGELLRRIDVGLTVKLPEGPGGALLYALALAPRDPGATIHPRDTRVPFIGYQRRRRNRCPVHVNGHSCGNASILQVVGWEVSSSSPSC